MTETPRPQSASQQMADALAATAVVDRQTAQAARVTVAPVVNRQRKVRIALAVAVPILIALVLVQFAWDPLISFFETAPPPAIATLQAQEMMNSVVAGVESYRKDYKALPATLIQIGIPQRGQWSYTPTGGGQYTIQGTVYGQSVQFNSSTAVKPVPEKR